MSRYDPPLSRCPSCLASRADPSRPCACGWGTPIPRYKGPPAPVASIGAVRARNGRFGDLGRALDAIDPELRA